VVRLDTVDPAVLAHGVVARDRDSAVVCHVQLDESQHNRGCTLRVNGLHPQASYRLEWLGPVDLDSDCQNPLCSSI
jgi:alpha-galactosidase